MEECKQGDNYSTNTKSSTMETREDCVVITINDYNNEYKSSRKHSSKVKPLTCDSVRQILYSDTYPKSQHTDKENYIRRIKKQSQHLIYPTKYTYVYGKTNNTQKSTYNPYDSYSNISTHIV